VIFGHAVMQHNGLRLRPGIGVIIDGIEQLSAIV
jgi:hypothetical protein